MGGGMRPYVDVSLPKELIEEMDKLIGQYGFRSRAEIAKEAIRQLLLRFTIDPHPNLEVPKVEGT